MVNLLKCTVNMQNGISFQGSKRGIAKSRARQSHCRHVRTWKSHVTVSSAPASAGSWPTKTLASSPRAGPAAKEQESYSSTALITLG